MKHTTVISLFAMVCALQLAVPAYMIAKYEYTLSAGHLCKFKTAPVDPYDALRGRYVALNLEQAAVPVATGHEAVFKRGRKVYAIVTVDKDGFAGLTDVRLQPPPSGDYVAAQVHYFENYPQFTDAQVKQPGELALKLLDGQDPVSVYLRGKLADHEKKLLNEKKAGLPQTCPPEVTRMMISFFNRIIGDYGGNSLLLADQVAGKTADKQSLRGYDWSQRLRRNAEFLVQSYPAELAPVPPARVRLKLPFDKYYINESLAPKAEQAYRDRSSRQNHDAYAGVRILKGTAVIEDLYLGGKPIHEYLKTTLPR